VVQHRLFCEMPLHEATAVGGATRIRLLVDMARRGQRLPFYRCDILRLISLSSVSFAGRNSLALLTRPYAPLHSTHKDGESWKETLSYIIGKPPRVTGMSKSKAR
jgi:hypothetical protein